MPYANQKPIKLATVYCVCIDFYVLLMTYSHFITELG
jgi:hypothetical protein